MTRERIRKDEESQPAARARDTTRAPASPLVDNLALAREAARLGTSEAAGTLPHAEKIQRSFGHHDLRGVEAHLGPAASTGAERMGANAFTVGNRVAFRGPPSLKTAAHEAAHAVQQRGGGHAEGGVGTAGDPWERQADAVAEAVTQGRSAEAILDQRVAGAGGPSLQREEAPAPKYQNRQEAFDAPLTAAELATIDASVAKGYLWPTRAQRVTPDVAYNAIIIAGGIASSRLPGDVQLAVVPDMAAGYPAMAKLVAAVKAQGPSKMRYDRQLIFDAPLTAAELAAIDASVAKGYLWPTSAQRATPDLDYNAMIIAGGIASGRVPGDVQLAVVPEMAAGNPELASLVAAVRALGPKKLVNWAKTDENDRALYIMRKLVKDYHYTPEGAAGLVGNILAESAALPTAVEVGPPHAGRGLVQWSFARREKLFAFSHQGEVLGEDILFDMDAQIAFMMSEIQGGLLTDNVLDDTLKSTKNPKTAADQVMADYEKPQPGSKGKRQKNAADLLTRYKQKYPD